MRIGNKHISQPRSPFMKNKMWGRRVQVLLPPIPDYVFGYAVVSQKILWNTLVSLYDKINMGALVTVGNTP